MTTEFYRRTIVTLCGSTRFSEAYQQANLTLTLSGKIVLTIGCDMKSDAAVFAGKSEEELDAIKAELDSLRRDKIAMSDEVLFLNVGGYMGKSTTAEWLYALRQGKQISFLEPEKVPKAAWDVMKMYAQVQAIRRVEAAMAYQVFNQSDIDALPHWSQIWKTLLDFQVAVEALATDWPEAKELL